MVTVYNFRNDTIRWQMSKSTNVSHIFCCASSYRFRNITILNYWPLERWSRSQRTIFCNTFSKFVNNAEIILWISNIPHLLLLQATYLRAAKVKDADLDEWKLYTHRHIHIHTNTHTHTHAYTHTHTHIHTRTHKHAYTNTHTHTRSYTHTSIHTYHKRSQTTHTHTYRDIAIRIHIYIYIYIYIVGIV